MYRLATPRTASQTDGHTVRQYYHANSRSYCV